MGICSDCSKESSKKRSVRDISNESIKPKKPKKSISLNKLNKPKEKKKNRNEDKIVHDNSLETNTSFMINVNYLFEPTPNTQKVNINEMSSILKLSLLKFIAVITKNEQLNKIENINMKKILQKLNKDLDLINKEGIIENKNELPKDVNTILKEKKGNNIFEYAKYINTIIDINDIRELIQIYEKNQKEKINNF